MTERPTYQSNLAIKPLEWVRRYTRNLHRAQHRSSKKCVDSAVHSVIYELNGQEDRCRVVHNRLHKALDIRCLFGKRQKRMYPVKRQTAIANR